MEYVVDASLPGPEQFKGVVKIELTDGRTVESVEEHNRGSRINPMSHDDLIGKFRENASGVNADAQIGRLADTVMGLEKEADDSVLSQLTVPGNV